MYSFREDPDDEVLSASPKRRVAPHHPVFRPEHLQSHWVRIGSPVRNPVSDEPQIYRGVRPAQNHLRWDSHDVVRGPTHVDALPRTNVDRRLEAELRGVAILAPD